MAMRGVGLCVGVRAQFTPRVADISSRLAGFRSRGSHRFPCLHAATRPPVPAAATAVSSELARICQQLAALQALLQSLIEHSGRGAEFGAPPVVEAIERLQGRAQHAEALRLRAAVLQWFTSNGVVLHKWREFADQTRSDLFLHRIVGMVRRWYDPSGGGAGSSGGAMSFEALLQLYNAGVVSASQESGGKEVSTVHSVMLYVALHCRREGAAPEVVAQQFSLVTQVGSLSGRLSKRHQHMTRSLVSTVAATTVASMIDRPSFDFLVAPLDPSPALVAVAQRDA